VNPSSLILGSQQLFIESPEQGQRLMSSRDMEMVEAKELPNPLGALWIKKVARSEERGQLVQKPGSAIAAPKARDQIRRASS
jgi:hypothetical protein